MLGLTKRRSGPKWTNISLGRLHHPRSTVILAQRAQGVVAALYERRQSSKLDSAAVISWAARCRACASRLEGRRAATLALRVSRGGALPRLRFASRGGALPRLRF